MLIYIITGLITVLIRIMRYCFKEPFN